MEDLYPSEINIVGANNLYFGKVVEIMSEKLYTKMLEELEN